ncbi:unnamed protein product [Mucor hiemalis]
MSQSESKELASTLDPAVVEQFVMAAVAAAAASLPQTMLLSSSSNSSKYSQQQYKLPTPLCNSFKDPITEKVRHDNRERKKRWRLKNQDRNKDNDLRCRVNKRAFKLFGKDDSDHKKKWVEEEFEKRRSKRKEKEDRKLNSPTQEGLHNLLTDPYISLLANTLTTTDTKDENKSEQFTTQLLEFLQQQQQQQQQQSQDFTNSLVLDESLVVEETPKVEEQVIKTEEIQQDTVMEEEPAAEGKEKPDYPIDAVLTLMQLNAGWRQ